MGTTQAEMIERRARELSTSPDQRQAAEELVRLTGTDRSALESARNHLASVLHNRTDDWEATAALTLLNRALAQYGWSDPYDWKVRWRQGRKP